MDYESFLTLLLGLLIVVPLARPAQRRARAINPRGPYGWGIAALVFASFSLAEGFKHPGQKLTMGFSLAVVLAVFGLGIIGFNLYASHIAKRATGQQQAAMLHYQMMAFQQQLLQQQQQQQPSIDPATGPIPRYQPPSS